jgi:hypothetical protein
MASRRDVGHPISYRIAQFVQFRSGKVIEYVSIIDSFDAVEQVLGHPLARKLAPAAGNEEFITV